MAGISLISNVVYEVDAFKGPKMFRTRRGVPVTLSKLDSILGNVRISASNFVGYFRLRTKIESEENTLLDETWDVYNTFFPVNEDKEMSIEHLINLAFPHPVKGVLVLELELQAYLGRLQVSISDISLIYQ